MIKKSLLLFSLVLILTNSKAQQTEIQYLSGTGKDHTVTWDFFCTKGTNSGKWSTIPVPSNWELQGFGAYNYGQTDTFHNEQGQYKFEFKVPKTWKNKRVYIVFEGSMTDTEVKINGCRLVRLIRARFIVLSTTYRSFSILEIKTCWKPW